LALADVISSNYRPFFGKYYAQVIRSAALTATQVLAEATFFRSLYPEIPNVQIGSQYWATSNLDVVCTPQGNVINEITDNANVSVITTPNFLTGWSTNAATIADNNNFTTTGTSGYIFKTAVTVIGKWYKCTIAGSFTGIKFNIEGSLNYKQWTSSPISETFFFKADSTTLVLRKINDLGTTATITTFTVDLVGWSGLSEVYDYIAGTTSEAAGQLAAAAWCHYNNDPAMGAIYGKLYNWYAAKTFQNDIDAFNAANPTTPWGWKVPAQADWTTLQTTLGGSTVAGGKIKKEGLTYWTTPNTGADNSSGFSAIPNGYRNAATGVVTGMGLYSEFWTTTGYRFYQQYTDSAIGSANMAGSFTFGTAIRLLKV